MFTEETDSPSIENNTEEMIKNKSLDINQVLHLINIYN